MADLALLQEASQAGDLVELTLDSRRTFLFNHPRLARHVLLDRARLYTKTKKDRPVFGDGLLTSEGADWVVQRRLAQRAFSPEALERQRSIVDKATTALLSGWDRADAFDLVPSLSRFTMRVAVESLLGVDAETAEVDTLNAAVATLLLGATPDFAPALTAFRAGIAGLLARAPRVAEPATIVSLFADTGLADQVSTFLLASSETTANALAWTFLRLADAPEAQDHARSSSAFLAAVIDETLRLDPPGWLLTREAAGADEVDGVRIAAGSIVLLSPRLLHRDARFWPEPERFQPLRFIDGEPMPFSYLPFGAGPRGCIGHRMATAQLGTVVGEALARYRIEKAPGFSLEALALFTLRPRYGAFVRLRPVTGFAR